jgi:hypothetical protein
MQDGPETVVAVGEVVAVLDGAGGVVQSAEHDVETFGQDVGFELRHRSSMAKTQNKAATQNL